MTYTMTNNDTIVLKNLHKNTSINIHKRKFKKKNYTQENSKKKNIKSLKTHRQKNPRKNDVTQKQ